MSKKAFPLERPLPTSQNNCAGTYRDLSVEKAYVTELAASDPLPFRVIFVEQMGEWVNDPEGLPQLMTYKKGAGLVRLGDMFAS